MQSHKAQLERHWKNHLENYDLFMMNHTKYLQMLEFHRQVMKGLTRILDSGAGTGNLTQILLKEDHEVTAVDNNGFALDVLRKKCQNLPGLNILQLDLEIKLPFEDSSFDGVTSCFVLPFVKGFETYFNEIYRVLKDGGKFSASIIMPIPGFMNGYILIELKKDLEKKDILPARQRDWDQIVQTSQANEKTIIKNGKSREEILQFLQKTGFKNIKERGSSYDKYVMFIECKK